MFFYVFSCNIIKVIIFCTVVCSFLHISFLLGPHSYVSIELIDCVLLSSWLSLVLNATLLTSSVNILFYLLLNLCYDFSISLLFFMNSLWFSCRQFISSLFFLVSLVYIFSIFKLSYFQTFFIIFKIKFSFHEALFYAFRFFVSIVIIC